MSKKVMSVFLTVCLLLGAVVLGVHLMHKDALAQNFPTQLILDWNGFNQFDCNATAELLDENGGVIAIIDLVPDVEMEIWSGTLVGDATLAVSVRFDWDVGLGGEEWWAPVGVPPVIIDVDYVLCFFDEAIAH